jgi:hypothetical protein
VEDYGEQLPRIVNGEAASDDEIRQLECLAAKLLDDEPLVVEGSYVVESESGAILHLHAAMQQDGVELLSSTIVGVALDTIDNKVFEASFGEEDEMLCAGPICLDEADLAEQALDGLLADPKLDANERALVVFMKDQLNSMLGKIDWDGPDDEIEVNPAELIRKSVGAKATYKTVGKVFEMPIADDEYVYVHQEEVIVTGIGCDVEGPEESLQVDYKDTEAGVVYSYANQDGWQSMKQLLLSDCVDFMHAGEPTEEDVFLDELLQEEIDDSPNQHDTLLICEALQRAIIRNNSY